MSILGSVAVLCAVGIPTYFMRSGLILVLGDRPLPSVVERALRNVGPAVMAALVVNLVAGGDEGIDGVTGAEIAALAVALAVAAWKKNLMLTLVCGMATLWIATAVA